MTDSHEQAYFLERFELVKEMLHDGDVDSAVASLVDLREKGFVNKELDQRIDLLRSEPTDEQISDAVAWIDKVVASIQGYGGDVFRMVEELSEAAVGLSEADWVEIDQPDAADGSGEPEEDEGAESEFGFGELEDVEAGDEVDGFDDLDEFSDLAEFSELDEFSDFEGLEGLSDLSEFEEYSDSSVAEKPEPSYDDAGDLADPVSEDLEELSAESKTVDADDDSANETVEGRDSDARESSSDDLVEDSAPSVDFAMLDESPSQVVAQLSEEEIKEAGARFAADGESAPDGDSESTGGEAGPFDAASDDSDASGVSEVSGASEASGVSEVSGASEASGVSEVSGASEVSSGSEVSEVSGGDLGELEPEELSDDSSSDQAFELSEISEEPVSEPISEEFELSEISEESVSEPISEEFELSEISEEEDASADESDETDGDDAFDLDFGLDDMDFDLDATKESGSQQVDADQPRGTSQEILLEDPIDEEPPDQEPPDEDVADEPEQGEDKTERPMQDRATRKHQSPTKPGQDSGAPEAPSAEIDGNETKVAGLNERTSTRQGPVSETAPPDALDGDAEFRETRKQQSVDPAAAAMAKGDADEGESSEEQALGAADDGFQLFSDSEAQEMGLAYSSSEDDESTSESVDPFDDDEELDPFEDDLGANPFSDDDLFGDVDEPASDADAEPTSGERRMPDSPSGEVRYRGSAPAPPEHRRGSSQPDDSDAGSNGPIFGDMGGASSVDTGSDESSGGNEFAREKTQRNESLADLASSMKQEGSSPASLDDEEDDDFDLGLSNPEKNNATAIPDGDDDGFDLGLSNPEEKNKTASPVDEDDDFDLGLSNPEEKNQGSRGSGSLEPEMEDEGVSGPGSIVEESSEPRVPDDENESSETFFGSLAPFQRDDSEAEDESSGTPSRHRQRDTSGSKSRIRFDSTPSPAPEGVERDLEPTPASLSAVSSEEEARADDSLDEDEFFDLAESLAQDSESSQKGSRPKYRGEPMLDGASEAGDDDEADDAPGNNPFAHEAPTGVQEALRESESSFVLEEIRSEGDEEQQVEEDVLLDEARRLFEKGEYAPAMDLVESVLEGDVDHSDALDLKKSVEDELAREHQVRLGSLDQTPNLKIDMGEIAGLDLDSRAGFLLSQMDGMSSLGDLLELSNMSRAETLSVVADLLDRDIISLD